jgi:hypothetical protein
MPSLHDGISVSRSSKPKGITTGLVKDNRNALYQDIQTLFAKPSSRPGWPAKPPDFRTAQTLEKGHGRTEKRRITGSLLSANYSDWPGLAQVFKLERQFTDALGQTQEASAVWHDQFTHFAGQCQTPAGVGTNWGIENGLHSRRDATLREDHSQLRMGHAPYLLAVLNNTALGLFARQGVTNVAEARREFASQVDKALHSLAS